MQEAPKPITIYRDGRTTDYGLARELSAKCPLSFRKAQDLLTAVAKFIKRSGFFTNDKKRYLKLQTEFSGLLHALEMEGLINEDPMVSFFDFMNIISVTFPNWQNEYSALNDLFLENENE